MRRIAAQYVFTGSGEMIRRGVVTLDEEGRIVAVEQLGAETAGTEFYNGILTPGFVNAHCHLELSHLQNVLPKGLGMKGFVEAMKGWPERAGIPAQDKIAAMQNADEAMHTSGIVAVGDISNSINSFSIKQNSPIHYHTFVEAVGLSADAAEEKKQEAEAVLTQALQDKFPASITPHAVYSMSDALFSFAVAAARKAGVLSIHHQEARGEGDAAWQALAPLIDEQMRLLLVHNTFTTPVVIEAVSKKTDKATWVLCPNSNKYINDVLPPAMLFYESGVNVALGTDSLASNTGLSILEEVKTLSVNFPEIPLEILLKWATLGGAKALGVDSHFGTLQVGRYPGLALIEGVDFQHIKLLSTAKCTLITPKV